MNIQPTAVQYVISKIEDVKSVHAVNLCLKNLASDWNITNCIGYKRLCADW